VRSCLAAPGQRQCRGVAVRRATGVHHPGAPAARGACGHGRRDRPAGWSWSGPVSTIATILHSPDGFALEQQAMVSGPGRSGNTVGPVVGALRREVPKPLRAAWPAAAVIAVLGCSVKATATTELQTSDPVRAPHGCCLILADPTRPAVTLPGSPWAVLGRRYGAINCGGACASRLGLAPLL
jgi:hypothetical protein